jgi:hypothetical protein
MDQVRNELVGYMGSVTPAVIAYTEQSRLLAPPQAMLAQALAYLRKRKPLGEYNNDDLVTILNAYWALSLRVGLDPVLAIAQMIHETDGLRSWWAGRPRRNPAGIGVNGLTHASNPPAEIPCAYDPSRKVWAEGLSFATWADHAVPAHLGRLLAYALRPNDFVTDAQADLRRRALDLRPLPLAVQGTAITVRQLGAADNPTLQGWANPGNGYGKRIALIAQAISSTGV